ncbi:LysM peptidoglycan-binding domain-containing M23 family metallopeptidase [Calothrix rhizosoleniae]|uniref:LysM peptidoglycan-binding domain-containing M23 family metallopeptidase n=1 Tax=Calothrix rhizosoleniae TaxID=888997 RepID=UPI000B49AE7F|nr:M23 family metallopeptidase [Calothrix rhizosoleniae]
MTFRIYILFLFGLANTLGLAFTSSQLSWAENIKANCPTPALERFLHHQVKQGENLENIAQAYNLKPESIIAMNPNLQNSKLAIGSKILIPPYNGIVVEVPRGQTWQQLGAQYKVRTDVLFELNGCQSPGNLAFIPVVNGKPHRPTIAKSGDTRNQTMQMGSYPLSTPAKLALPYGWQINPADNEVFFHSGIDLLANQGTNVQAIAPGTVVLAQAQGSYGNLVIINHNGSLQSRYAHLDSINVKVGQQVQAGDLLGVVGTTGAPNLKQPHLHFEVRSRSSLGWVAKDPKTYLTK